MVNDFLEEDVVYEVLLCSHDLDDNNHVRPIGMRFDGEFLVFSLFNNRTLTNLVDNPHFSVFFTNDSLLYVLALLGSLDCDDYFWSNVSHIFNCDVLSFDEKIIDDSYGTNTTTKIIAKVVNIKEINPTLPLINRATNNIIELLVDFSRFDLMDVYEKNNFYEKLDYCENIVNKTGNKKHKKAIRLIKKEIKEK